DIRRVYRRISRVRHIEHIVKPSEKYRVFVVHRVRENAEKLLWQKMLFDAEVIIQPRLRSPAYMEGGADVGLAPLEYLAQLLPVLDLLELKMLDRRSCDYHSVEALILHLIEGLVKAEQMLCGGVFGHMARGVHKLYLDLQSRVSQKPCELRF